MSREGWEATLELARRTRQKVADSGRVDCLLSIDRVIRQCENEMRHADRVTSPHERDQMRVRQENSRALQRGQTTQVSYEEWKALCAQYGNVCIACKQSKPLGMDHVTPYSKGGRHIIDNIQPMCFDCNIRKYTKSTDYR